MLNFKMHRKPSALSLHSTSCWCTSLDGRHVLVCYLK